MQCIYSYVPEEVNHVHRVYNVAAIHSVVTAYGACNVISHCNHFVLLH